MHSLSVVRLNVLHSLCKYKLNSFLDTLYFQPTLKVLAAQSIVNNNITTEEIPKLLQKEM